ncbi:MAG: hypothetical protein SOY68_14215, partial [Fusobacterium varium]|nr:hypothetical protein [Fusobacterium varium]
MNRVRKYKESIIVRDIMEHFNMELINEGDLDFEITTPSIYQIGYELIGFFDEDGDELNKYLH